MLFGQKVALLTLLVVVIFQILENFLYSPPRGSSVVRTKGCLTHPPRGSNFSDFRNFPLLTPMKMTNLPGHETQMNKIIVQTYIAFLLYIC